jgi:hypothetical protein
MLVTSFLGHAGIDVNLYPLIFTVPPGLPTHLQSVDPIRFHFRAPGLTFPGPDPVKNKYQG